MKAMKLCRKYHADRASAFVGANASAPKMSAALSILMSIAAAAMLIFIMDAAAIRLCGLLLVLLLAVAMVILPGRPKQT